MAVWQKFHIEEPRNKLRGMFCRSAEPTGNALTIAVQFTIKKSLLLSQPVCNLHVYIRKHEKLLKFIDDSLAGSYASGTIDGIWEKIRKSWHYPFTNLENLIITVQ